MILGFSKQLPVSARKQGNKWGWGAENLMAIQGSFCSVPVPRELFASGEHIAHSSPQLKCCCPKNLTEIFVQSILKASGRVRDFFFFGKKKKEQGNSSHSLIVYIRFNPPPKVPFSGYSHVGHADLERQEMKVRSQTGTETWLRPTRHLA